MLVTSCARTPVEVLALSSLIHTYGGCTVWNEWHSCWQRAICKVLKYDPKKHGNREQFLKEAEAAWDKGSKDNEALETFLTQYRTEL